MNSGRFCESEFWTAKVAMNRMSKGNTFYGRKAHITSCVDYLSESLSRDFMFDLLTQRPFFLQSNHGSGFDRWEGHREGTAIKLEKGPPEPGQTAAKARCVLH